jgi:hypothetical protein
MWLKILQENDEAFVLNAKTFSEGKKTIYFFPSKRVDTINVWEIDRLSGLYNPIFKKKAESLDFWYAVTTHEVMHFFSEFIAPWYAPMDVLPEGQSSVVLPIIPNVIEDIVINHTLWLWEENPIRSAGYSLPGITEKLIICHENFPFKPSLPPSVRAVVENLNMIHIDILKLIIKQKRNSEIKESHFHLKNRLQGNIFHSLAPLVNTLLNSRAVSVTKDGRTINVNLNITGTNTKLLVYETRYKGKPIPQFVPLNNEIVAKIYDLLDEHFAKTYDIKLDTLRKKAYTSYKKKLANHRQKASDKKNNAKSMMILPRIYRKYNSLIVDFNLKYENNIQERYPEKKGEPVIQNMMISRDFVSKSWERFTRMKSGELLRLKKWL